MSVRSELHLPSERWGVCPTFVVSFSFDSFGVDVCEDKDNKEEEGKREISASFDGVCREG
jgi:hypothetical protein